MSPRPVVHDRALRDRLVQCAATAIADRGVAGLSLRKVATAAGTSTSAVYSLFGSRDDLVGAVISESIGSFLHSQHSVPITHDPVEDLKNLGRSYRRWALARPDMYHLMFGDRSFTSGLTPQALEDLEAGVGPVRAAFQRGIETGVFTPSAPVSRVAILLWTCVHGFVSLELAQWSAIPLPQRDALFDLTLESQGAHWRAV